MSDSGYTGYLFEFSTDDLNPADGLRKTRVLAIARSVDEAKQAANAMTSDADLELIEVGTDVLAEARMAGVEHDQAKVVARVDGLE
ncbi:hypothetical protein [Aureimonas leprariae]|uniref:Uncharacterized protein n=1 Tax=Plantimonas leprariae TaxID=2615207 RepID=A0A7V7TVK0_9HYPH|nr:hypothetical protein [Aureimonas leprariae]KAB0678087.1 hypothetical protein F6X38_16820 [Aureimonas leprariae]